MINRRRFLASTAALLASASMGPSQGWAADSAERRMLFGYPPGALGSELGKSALALLAANGGPSYQLINVEGRNTRLASERVKVAAPDGLTLLQAQGTTMCLLPNVYTRQTFDPAQDFAPLATIGDMTLSLTLGPVVPKTVTTLDQYLDWVADNPDLRNIGFSIYGSEGHLATLMLARAKGVAVRPQPYRGSKMMIDDLLSQSLAAGFTAAGNGKDVLWSSGRLRSIGVTSAQRLTYWPGVPSLAEQGVKALDLSSWYGWFAPAATSASIVGPLREKILAMQATPAYADLHKKLLLTQAPLDPEQIRERIRKDTARYAQLVATYGPEKATDSDMPVVGESHGR